MFSFNLLPCMFIENEIQRSIYYFDIDYPINPMSALWWSRPIWFKFVSEREILKKVISKSRRYYL